MVEEKLPLESTTRTFNTTHGVVSYAQLADLIAPNLLNLLNDIENGKYAERPYDEQLLLEFHQRIVGDILPQIAGHWRKIPVQVGNWLPPEPYDIPLRMREYVKNIQTRMNNATDIDLQIEALAYAEGEFLSIHPFQDFNGRTIRAALDLLLINLDLPLIDVSVKRDTNRFKIYQNALADYDNGRIAPLVDFWRQRLQDDATV